MALTPKQQRFVEEYLIDLNATAAAKRAGYSEDTARQMGAENLSKPVIQEAIQTAKAQRNKRTRLKQSWVVDRLRENVERSMQIVPVLDREGNPTGEYMYRGSVANKALELLGKHLGMFVDRLNVNVKGGFRVEIIEELVDAGNTSQVPVNHRSNGVPA